jgi:hypothetical protein
MANKIWQRWKRLAHRAAEIQSLVILTVLYWLVVAPIGATMKIGRRGGAAGAEWKTRPPAGPVPIEQARRQF